MTQTAIPPTSSALAKFFKKKVATITPLRGVISLVTFTVVWEISTIIHLPIIGNGPAPSEGA